MKTRGLFVLSFVIVFFSCQDHIKKMAELPPLSDYKKPPTRVDSIPTNIPVKINPSTHSLGVLPFMPDTVKLVPNPVRASNIIPAKADTTFPPAKQAFLKYVKPIISKGAPYISTVQHPQPVRAGELRSTGSSNENIMYLDVEQGLPISGISDMKFDHKGNLWIATRGALIKYDGYYLSSYTTRSGLASNGINSILIDKDSSLWLGTDDGLINFDGTYFKTYNETSGLVGNHIGSLKFDHDNNIWLSVNGEAVYKFDRKNFYGYTVKDHGLDPQISSIAIDSLNRVFIGHWCMNYECLVNDTVLSKLTEYDSWGSACGMVSYSDRSKNLWIGSYNGGAVQVTSRGSVKYIPNTGIHYVFFSSFYEDAKGKMWLGTNEGGLLKKDGDKFVVYTTAQGLTTNKISCITGDKNNDIWIGTEGGGICKITQGSFRSFGLSDGLTDKNIIRIMENSRGHILLGTWAEGVWLYNKGKFNQLKGSGINLSIILSMAEDKHNNLHVCYHSHGYHVFRPSDNDSVPYSRATHETANNKFENRFVYSMKKDSKGNIWSADAVFGLSSYQDSFYLRFDRNAGLATNQIHVMAFDKQENIWLGSNCGLSFIKNKTVTNYTKKEGLPANEFRTLIVDHNNELWAGCAKGLVHYDGKEFKTFTTKDGLSADFVSSIIEDHKNRLWIGTSKGLNILTRDSSGKYQFINFLVQDGLKSIYFLQNSVLEDSKHNLWWGTAKNLVQLNLDEFESKQIKPTVYISQINLMDSYINYTALWDSIANGGPYYNKDSSVNFSKVEAGEIVPYSNYPKSLNLPYDINSIAFNFYSFGGDAVHHIKYRYRLAGYNDSWSETAFPEVVYSNLSYGNYRFEVQAKVDGFSWGEATIYRFTIRPPFWSTWLFRIFAAVSFVGLIFTIFKIRNKKLLERQARLEEVVRIRTLEINQQKAIIEEKQKSIVDSINYSKRIQRAQLPTDIYVEKSLKRLKGNIN